LRIAFAGALDQFGFVRVKACWITQKV
jgi:hypothetical protein